MSTGDSSLSRLIGTPPINPILFTTSKLAVAVAWALALIQFFGGTIRQPVAGIAPLAAALAAGSLFIFALASLSLGRSLRVGLPSDATALKTSGIYRFTRHPI